MAKMKKCATCGTDIASNAKMCPKCGDPNKKPFYRRPGCIIFILIAALLIGLPLLYQACEHILIGLAEDGSSALVVADGDSVSPKDLLDQCGANTAAASAYIGKEVKTFVCIEEYVYDEHTMIEDNKNHIRLIFSSGSLSPMIYMRMNDVTIGDVIMATGTISNIDRESGFVEIDKVQEVKLLD